ncbi:MAG: hypothetical protein OEU92_11265 [Alphaproteobacteria bacterium]|nr:hypothetical protein [Alphaproteobacteria bacterium]
MTLTSTTTAKWKAFPCESKAYEYAGANLKKHWPRLHQGDCEPFPDQAWLKRLLAAHPELEPAMSIKKVTGLLQNAWRAFHRGDFAEAFESGLAVGPLGYNVTNKTQIIYASYLEDDPERKSAELTEAAHRAVAMQAAADSEVNCWFLHGQALGRYGQELSVARALAEGLGGKVKASLERSLALEPRHADAHIALGTYHAAVIHGVGETIGGLTHGASRKASLDHFEEALQLNPGSAIARIEYANGLVMMFGKPRMEQAIGLYEEAAVCQPADATERFDVELAKSELAD